MLFDVPQSHLQHAGWIVGEASRWAVVVAHLRGGNGVLYLPAFQSAQEVALYPLYHQTPLLPHLTAHEVAAASTHTLLLGLGLVEARVYQADRTPSLLKCSLIVVFRVFWMLVGLLSGLLGLLEAQLGALIVGRLMLFVKDGDLGWVGGSHPTPPLLRGRLPFLLWLEGQLDLVPHAQLLPLLSDCLEVGVYAGIGVGLVHLVAAVAEGVLREGSVVVMGVGVVVMGVGVVAGVPAPEVHE